MNDLIGLRHLVTLEAVARRGSFAAAADELACTQSAVSQQIAEIERRIGVRVLDRRPVRLTAAGQILLEAELGVRIATAAAAQKLAALLEGQTGLVRLGAFDSAAMTVVPAALARLRLTHPDIEVRLSQLETEASHAQLLRGDLDLALTFDYDRIPQPPPPNIRRTLVAEDPVLAVLPESHPLASRDEVGLAELADDAWIGTSVTGLQLDLLAKLSCSSGFKPRLAFDGEDFQIILQLVAHDLGIAILPKLATLQAPPGLVVKPIAGNPLTRFIYTSRLDVPQVPVSLNLFEQALAETVQSALDI